MSSLTDAYVRQVIRKLSCRRAGEPSNKQLCRGSWGRWLRPCSAPDTASSGCRGNQVVEADSNLRFHSTVGGWIRKKKRLWETHKKKHTPNSAVEATWPHTGSGRVAGRFNLIQSGLRHRADQTVSGRLELDGVGNIGSATAGWESNGDQLILRVRACLVPSYHHGMTRKKKKKNLSHHNFLCQILKDSSAKWRAGSWSWSSHRGIMLLLNSPQSESDTVSHWALVMWESWMIQKSSSSSSQCSSGACGLAVNTYFYQLPGLWHHLWGNVSEQIPGRLYSHCT